MPRDYYLVLGINKTADLNRIKKAYRTVAKKCHPDVSHEPESSERFQEVREAYETLADEGKRRQYDQELERQGSRLRISKVPQTIQKRRSVFDGMEDFFSHADEFFSGFVPGLLDRGVGREKDLYYEVILSPGEASQGGLFPLTVPVIEDCPKCSKTGYWVEFFCSVCYGHGRVRSEREFSVSIPPNVKNGTEVCLSLEDIGLKDAYINIVVFVDPNIEEHFW
jgi:DnaJ-class molecular chaperone